MTSHLTQTEAAKRDAFLRRLRERSRSGYETLRAASDDVETFERIEREISEGDAREALEDPAAESAEATTERKDALRGGVGLGPPQAPIAAAQGAPLPKLPPRLSELLQGGEPTAERLADLRAAMGFKNIGGKAAELKAERIEARQRVLEQAKELEIARALVREQLGEFTKDERKRLEQTKPTNAGDVKDAEHLGRNVWAISRQASTGSARDLAYAISQMLTLAPIEAVGCWIVEAMGMGADGVAHRQLYTAKARRKLVRSFVLWMSGRNDRLRHIAGSPSKRTVRGVKRCPQKLLARIAALGDKPWSRSTTTRDANESHAAGLYRRVRLPHALAHESEKCGPSGQVVSRYWMELPRQPKPKSRFALPEQVGGIFVTAGVTEDPLGWVREHAKNGIVYAMRSVTTVRRRLGELVHVPGMLAPLLHAPP